MGKLKTARIWGDLLARSFRKPLVVFTPAKVGTTSITNASVAVARRLALHVHFVTPDASRRFVANPGVVQKDLHRATSSYCRRLVWPRRSVQVVTVVRDPVGHAVSLFFNFGARLNYLPPVDEQDTVDIQDVVQNFVDFFDRGGVSGLCFNGESDWFRDEFEVATGCDVYGQDFDDDRGYELFESGRFSVLLLKFEMLPEVAPPAMQAFLGLSNPLTLKHRHATADKDYGVLYQRFKAETVMPSAVLDRAYGSAFASHFYSSEDIDHFAARWS